MRSINLVVIHCAATPNGVWVSPSQINEWHRARGFHRDPKFAKTFRPQLPNIGYHRLILADGTISFGRDLEEVGAHVQGHNANSVGICMVGTTSFFLHQWEALRETICTLSLAIARDQNFPIDPKVYPVPSVRDALAIYRALDVEIKGHRDLSPDLNHDGVIDAHEWLKICPGFDVKAWIDMGMEPEPVNVLDAHPAISQVSGVDRAMSSMRYGVA